VAYDDIVDALEKTWAAIERTVAPCTERDYERATPCPGWTVRDVLSHLAGFERMLDDEPVPVHAGEYPPYVRNPIGEINEAFVAQWRARPGPEVLDLFRAAASASIARLRTLSVEEWERVGWSPEGERPYHHFMETRVLDGWIHLGDIRDALDLGGDDHGPGEAVVLGRFAAVLPFVLGKRVRPPEGTRIAVTLLGPRASRHVVGVRDGRGSELEVDLECANELVTSTALFWRRCAGRIDAPRVLSDPSTEVRGDLALAAALVDGLPVMI
jgi:uncharacterized protein (TIGR03083 family)